MSKTNFTPAPWVVDYRGTIGHIKSVSRLVDQTPTVCIYDVKTPSLSDAEKKANSSLIAAAPEMYAMLNTIADILNGDEWNINVHHRNIQKLLAKVRGESGHE